MKDRFNYLITANAMMTANLLSILVSLIITVLYYDYSPLTSSLLMEVGVRIGRFTDPVCGAIIIFITLYYERPIRSVLRRLHNGDRVDPE